MNLSMINHWIRLRDTVPYSLFRMWGRPGRLPRHCLLVIE